MHNSLAFFVLTRITLNLNVSLSLQFEASLCYFWSFNLIATKEPFFSDYISGDVSAETVKSAEEDSKVETGPENGLFWSRRLDRYSTISTILNFQCPVRNRKGGSVTGNEKHPEPRHLLLAREPVQIIYINIYIYYTRFQKGFHIERYIDRYIPLFSYTCARVHLHLLLSNLWKNLVQH